jgi:hypothetical protein
MTDRKPVDNVEDLNYLGSMITNDARCTREIKASIAMEKAEFNKKRTLVTSEASDVLHLEHSFVWCGNLDSSETRSEVPGKF